MRKAIAHSVVPLDVAGEVYIAGEDHLFKPGSLLDRNSGAIVVFRTKIRRVKCANHLLNLVIIGVSQTAFNPAPCAHLRPSARTSSLSRALTRPHARVREVRGRGPSISQINGHDLL